MTEITFKIKNGEKKTVTYDGGANLDEMVAKLGAEAVYSLAHQKLVIWAADFCRPKADAGMNVTEIQALLDARKPGAVGVRTPRGKKDTFDSFLAEFAKMSPEEQIAALTKMKETQRQGQI